MNTGRSVAALALSGVLIAAADARAQTAPLSMEGYPAPGAPAIVTVISPGAAPGKPLRYVVSASHKARLVMTMTTGMVMQMGQQSMPMDLPAMTTEMDVAVNSVAADGDIDYSFAFIGLTVDGGPGANPAVVAGMQAAAAGIKSIKGGAVISNRGVTRSVSLDISDPAVKQMLAQMRSSLENLSMPLPEEAVGVGAIWEVRQAISSGQTLFQKARYELVSMEGSSLSLRVKMEQTAPPQTISNPALPAGADIRLEKLSGSGSGTIALRLDSLVPTSEMEITTSSVMMMNIEGQSQSMTADLKLKLTMAPGKP